MFFFNWYFWVVLFVVFFELLVEIIWDSFWLLVINLGGGYGISIVLDISIEVWIIVEDWYIFCIMIL